MSYEVLVTLAVINAIATILLWRKVASGKINERPRLKKKAATALWRSAPIVPRHNPPKAVDSVRDTDRLFFADFKDFADVMNWWLADEFSKSPFRLQDLPQMDVSLNVDHSGGPVNGRCFALYYNQIKLGRVEVRPSYEYRTESPEVFTSVEVDWARFIGFGELTEFLGAIAIHVTSENPKNDDRTTACQSINRSLTETLWGNYRISQYDKADDQDWGELKLSFRGTADFYIDRRNAPARVLTTGGNAARKEPSRKSNVSARPLRQTAIIVGVLISLALVLVFGRQ